jgi:hypothetical protein
VAAHEAQGEPERYESGRTSRTLWRDRSGLPLVEVVKVAGFGHGAPIDSATGAQPSAHMLDFGIDSTAEITRFWGLTDRASQDRTARGRSAAKRRAAPPDPLGWFEQLIVPGRSRGI